jgi:hypothetical protein
VGVRMGCPPGSFSPAGMVAPECVAGAPTRTDRCLPPMGPMRMARGAPKLSKIGQPVLFHQTSAVGGSDASTTVRRNALKTPAKMGEKVGEGGGRSAGHLTRRG